ncbi:MAG: DsbA family protein [Geminicoccaceae bacterium]|nr:DsbA family protein [Geminicoccaceae bacterium]
MAKRRGFLALTLAAGVVLASVSGSQAAEVKERVMGDPNAPLAIVEYASYSCPHCAAFHDETLPTIKARYIDTGKAKLVYREFPLDQSALTASVLAQCAGDRYFQFSDAFFSSQAEWAGAADPKAALVNLARLGGLSPDQIDACLADEAMTDAVLQMRLDGAQKHEIASTPSFLIGDDLVAGDVGPEAMSAAIDKALAAKG